MVPKKNKIGINTGGDKSPETNPCQLEVSYSHTAGLIEIYNSESQPLNFTYRLYDENDIIVLQGTLYISAYGTDVLNLSSLSNDPTSIEIEYGDNVYVGSLE